MATGPVRRYQNISGQTIGVVIRKADGRFGGIPCYPGETVDLDHDEQVATANAPRDPRSNVLANGQMKVIMDDLEAAERRPLVPVAGDIQTQDPANPATWEGAQVEQKIDEAQGEGLPTETAAAVSLSGESPVGSFQRFEETGSPESISLNAHQEPPIGEGSIVPQAALEAERIQREREAAEMSAGASVEVNGRDVARQAPPAQMTPRPVTTA